MKKNLITALLFVYLLLTVTSCSPEARYDLSLIPVETGDKYGFIDSKGKFIINPQFSYATFFSDGLALIGIDGKYGFINKKGEIVINPVYKDATSFFDGAAWVVRENGAPTVIDKKGKEIFCIKSAEQVTSFREGLSVYSDYDSKGERRMGCVDTKGKILISPNYRVLHPFQKGLAVVRSDDGNNYGYIDKKGKIAINFQFDYAHSFEDNGQAIVSIANAGCGTIDKDGKFVINPQFQTMAYDKGNYVIKIGDKYGWCDKKGTIIINPQFDYACPFGESSLALIRMGDKCGYIDKDGKIAINPQFDQAFPFWNNIAAVKIEKGEDAKWGFINKEGKFVINPQFSSLGNSSEVVYSDYFNIEGIILKIKQMINENSIDGISFQTTLSDIMKKYSLSESDFKTYNTQHKLKTFILSNDASMTLYMNGEVYNKVSDGWWGYNYVVKNGATPESFVCYITFENRGAGKEEIAFTEITKAFGIDPKSTAAQIIKHGNIFLTFEKSYHGIQITATPDKPKKNNYSIEEQSTVDNGTKSTQYTGTINNKYNIVMNLAFEAGKIVGDYYYTSQKAKIQLEGSYDEEDIIIKESVNGKHTGTFSGKIVGNEISGTWINADGNKTMPFLVNCK